MLHTLRLYGNLDQRTWRLDEEPPPDPAELGDWNPRWELLATVTVPDGTELDWYPQDLEQ